MRCRLSPLLLLVFLAPVARAELAEELMAFPTDGAAVGSASGGGSGHDGTPLFPQNPAETAVKNLTGGGLLLHSNRKSTLDHTSQGGDKFDSSVDDTDEAAGLLLDLGAGAGLGVSDEMQYHHVRTMMDGTREHVEATTVQQTQAKLVLELTDGLKAAAVMRYFHETVVVDGNPFLGQGQQNHYRVNMLGIGSGFAYRAKEWGLGYAYFPPLHGKTDVAAEERLVTDPGFIVADAFYQPSQTITAGLSFKRWINQEDDLSRSTTAADNRTTLSLRGLDVDQYVIPQQLIELGGTFALGPAAQLRALIGRQTSYFDFNQRFQYGGVGVRQNGGATVPTTLLGAGLRYATGVAELQVGADYEIRSHDFPDDWNGGSYQAATTRLFVTISGKI